MRSRTFVHAFRLALAGLLIGTVASETSLAEKNDSFQTVVRSRFKLWDLNQDGKLSPEEVGELLQRITVTGKGAAALAAIHVFQRHPLHVKTPVTLEFLLRHQARGKDERRDQNRRRPHFEDDYQEFLEHLDRVPRQLFVGKAPALAGFSQGNLGDCYFLAVVGAAVRRDPQFVRNLIQPHADGSFDVAFPNGKKTTVRKLTDGDILLGSSAGKQGLWLNVLEKGFGTIRQENPISKIRKGKGIDTTAIDSIAHGGNPVHTIALLTGHKGAYLEIWKNVGEKSKPPEEKDVPELVRKVRAVLIEAQQEKRLVCCCTDTGKLPAGIIDDHAYAVVKFDPDTGVVHVWNPWGNHHVPKGKPGRENGYLTQGGHFELPLRQFVHVFEGLYYETAKK